MTEKENPAIRRGASILIRGTPVSNDSGERDTFVVYNNQVALGGSRISHRGAAFSTNLYYPETKDDTKPQVDDGGQMFDDGTKIIIGSYFTVGMFPKALYDASYDQREQVKKEIRRKTGQLIANIMDRTVVVEHEDKTQDQFSPQG